MPRLRADRLKLLPAIALLVGAAAIGACGNGKGDEATGKQLFTQKCGACHVLANAGTKGVQGPNLDLAFKQSIADGLGRSTIRGVVRKQIEFPQGGVMPSNLVKGQQAEDVAAYVADAIGKAGGAAGGGPSGTAKANAQNVVQIPTDPTGQLAASFHLYNFNACKDEACWTSQIAPVANVVPVVTGELGEDDCAHGFVDAFMPWADARGISYLGWSWNTWDCKTGPALIASYDGTPTEFGAGIKARFLAR